MYRRSFVAALAAFTTADCGARRAGPPAVEAEPVVERFETGAPTCPREPLDAAAVTVEGRTVLVDGRVRLPCGATPGLAGASFVGGRLRVVVEANPPLPAPCTYACAHAAPYELAVRVPRPSDRVVVVHDGERVTTWRSGPRKG